MMREWVARPAKPSGSFAVSPGRQCRTFSRHSLVLHPACPAAHRLRPRACLQSMGI